MRRMVAILLVFVLFLISCASPDLPPPPTATAVPSPLPTATVQAKQQDRQAEADAEFVFFDDRRVKHEVQVFGANKVTLYEPVEGNADGEKAGHAELVEYDTGSATGITVLGGFGVNIDGADSGLYFLYGTLNGGREVWILRSKTDTTFRVLTGLPEYEEYPQYDDLGLWVDGDGNVTSFIPDVSQPLPIMGTETDPSTGAVKDFWVFDQDGKAHKVKPNSFSGKMAMPAFSNRLYEQAQQLMSQPENEQYATTWNLTYNERNELVITVGNKLLYEVRDEQKGFEEALEVIRIAEMDEIDPKNLWEVGRSIKVDDLYGAGPATLRVVDKKLPNEGQEFDYNLLDIVPQVTLPQKVGTVSIIGVQGLTIERLSLVSVDIANNSEINDGDWMIMRLGAFLNGKKVNFETVVAYDTHRKLTASELFQKFVPGVQINSLHVDYFLNDMDLEVAKVGEMIHSTYASGLTEEEWNEVRFGILGTNRSSKMSISKLLELMKNGALIKPNEARVSSIN